MCPNCGYCPHCGRAHPYPYVRPYVAPGYPIYPYWTWGAISYNPGASATASSYAPQINSTTGEVK